MPDNEKTDGGRLEVADTTSGDEPAREKPRVRLEAQKERSKENLKERMKDPSWLARKKAKLRAISEEDPNVYPLH